MIEFHCPHCDKLLKTPDDKAGVRANCPGCGQSVKVPESATSATFLDDSAEPAKEGEPGAVRGRSTPGRGTGPGSTIPCPMCGEQIPAGSLRCTFCGEEVRPGKKSDGGRAAHRGVLILVFGILGLVCCFPFAIVAWVLASQDLKAMDDGRMDDEGRGLTVAGKVLGIIQCCLMALGLVFYGVMFLIMLLSGQM